jgi:hypothetical protein
MSERAAMPTGKLQFLEKTVDGRKVKILQQEFSGRDRFSGATFTEWRDVPLVTE